MYNNSVFVNYNQYDYHGHWEKKTGHVAPLRFHSKDDVDYYNSEYTLNYWIRLGADPSKLIMGFPMYGQSFTLQNPRVNGLNAPSKRERGNRANLLNKLDFWLISKYISFIKFVNFNQTQLTI